MDNRQASQFTTGIVIVAIGLLLLAGELDLGWGMGRLWPIILIAIGAGRFLGTGSDGRRGNGGWFLFLGAIFLLNNVRILMLHDSWPLFIVAAGVSVMAGRGRQAGPRGPQAPPEPPGPAGLTGAGRVEP
jgi:hypothetical protein